MMYISENLNKNQIFLKQGNLEDFAKVFEYDYKHLNRSMV